MSTYAINKYFHGQTHKLIDRKAHTNTDGTNGLILSPSLAVQDEGPLAGNIKFRSLQ